MAAAARAGESRVPVSGNSTPAATGTSAALYANAQNRFCRMFAIVARDAASAVGTPARLPETSTTSAASTATSAPVPIAIPTSASASAGASLMPSPTKATGPWRARRAATMPALSPGRASASTAPMPASRAIAAAAAWESPVIMAVAKPLRPSAASAARASGLSGSASASIAASAPSTATKTGVRPLSSALAAASFASSSRTPSRSISRLAPISTAWPCTSAARPNPGIARTDSAAGISSPRSWAASVTACPRGCPDCVSAAAASRRISASSSPPKTAVSAMRGAPCVSVPVLSKATTRTSSSR